MAAELGFEPRHCESESHVLPLHHSASPVLLLTNSIITYPNKMSISFSAFLTFLRNKPSIPEGFYHPMMPSIYGFTTRLSAGGCPIAHICLPLIVA